MRRVPGLRGGMSVGCPVREAHGAHACCDATAIVAHAPRGRMVRVHGRPAATLAPARVDPVPVGRSTRAAGAEATRLAADLIAPMAHTCRWRARRLALHR